MSWLIRCLLIPVLIGGAARFSGPAGEYDLLITGGRIVDGSGSPAYEADILIRDGVIQKIGEVSEPSVKRIIQAGGRTVTPGFIDTHAHGNPLQTPQFANFLSMGVTTISLGQDGRSPAAGDVAGWMDRVDEQGTGVNVLHFSGHASVRGQAGAPLTAGMQTLIRQAMKAGSFGVTTGLEYDPGRHADLEELAAIAVPGELFMSHMRSEDDDRIEASVRELLETGRRSGARIHISHLKIVFADDPERAGAVLELLSEARREGLPVTADLYPYTASYTGIGIVFPAWARPPHFQEAVRTRRDELSEYLRNRVNRRNGPEATLFGTHPWTGMTLAEIADSLGKPFEDVLIDDIGPRGGSAAYFVMDESVMRRFLADPHVMIASDGSPSMQHPRGYGSFAKIIRKYVIEEKYLTLEEAVRKMTGLPASTLELDDPERVEIPRGYLREGYAADILIFDPARIKDRATFGDPHRLATGFDWVLVNGAAVMEKGSLQERFSGSVLRRKYKKH
ncbi:MAG: amidohydrolase family protein [Balneolales bacterium]